MTGAWAFVFPGQGTQRAGMGDLLRRVHPPARDMFAEASEVLGFDLATLCRRGPETALRATENAQAALFVTGCAYADFLRARGVRAAAAAGHSVGELCALATAGALRFSDGVALVHARGRLMAGCRTGTMTSIVGLGVDTVASLAAELSEPERGELAVVAVVNAPDDVVVSGHRAAVERVADAASREPRVRQHRLRVSGAFHSPLIEPVVAEWTEHVNAVPLAEPALPVPLNATGTVARSLAELRAAVAAQLTAPVRWALCVRALVAHGVRRAVECGDSRTLQRINAGTGLDTVAARSPDDLVRAVRDHARCTTGADR